MTSASAISAQVTDSAVSAATPSLLTIGIDVGGTKIACVVTDSTDTVLLHESVRTASQDLPTQLSQLIRRAVERFAGEHDQSVVAVGVALPGHVDPDTGAVSLAVNLGGAALALGPLLEKQVGLPCYIEHDARAAASWIEAAERVADAPLDLAYLSVGTGISAGIVLDGRIFRGANGLAGEVGHMAGDPDGEACACGLIGCVETVAAGPALARMARAAIGAGRVTTLGVEPTATDVFRAAAMGDELARELATTIAERLARAIRGLVLTLGVRYVVIGGGVAAAGDALLGPVLDAIGRERQMSPLIEAAFARARVELLPPHVEAGARGAAAIARQRVIARHREGVGER